MFGVYKSESSVIVLLFTFFQPQLFLSAAQDTENTTEILSSTIPSGYSATLVVPYKDEYYFNIFGLRGSLVYGIISAVCLAVIILLIASIYYTNWARKLPTEEECRRAMERDVNLAAQGVGGDQPLDFSQTILGKYLHESQQLSKEGKDHTGDTCINVITDSGGSTLDDQLTNLESASQGGVEPRKPEQKADKDLKSRRKSVGEHDKKDKGKKHGKKKQHEHTERKVEESHLIQSQAVAPQREEKPQIVNIYIPQGPAVSDSTYESSMNETDTSFKESRSEQVLPPRQPTPIVIHSEKEHHEKEHKKPKSRRVEKRPQKEKRPPEKEKVEAEKEHQGPVVWFHKFKERHSETKADADTDGIDKPVLGRKHVMDYIRYDLCMCCFRRGQYQAPKGWTQKGEMDAVDNWNPMAEMCTMEQNAYIEEMEKGSLESRSDVESQSSETFESESDYLSEDDVTSETGEDDEETDLVVVKTRGGTTASVSEGECEESIAESDISSVYTVT